MKSNNKNEIKEDFSLWGLWWAALQQLRGAFGRTRTFMWFAVAVVGLSIRQDLAGVTSIVRILGLQDRCYDRLLDLFHSPAFEPDKLAQLWLKLALKLFTPYRAHGRLVLLGDGIKVAKEGRKMPGVKSLHQESQDNSKAEYIMGHSCQALSLLAQVGENCVAVPIISRIHEGLVFSNRCQKTVLDRMLEMLAVLKLSCNSYLVADCYYAAAKIVQGLLASGHHLISRVKTNAVAYELPTPETTKKAGRKKLYGKKLRLYSLFKNTASFSEAKSPCYGEIHVIIRIYTLDLIWRPVGKLMRFVLVSHPNRGKIVLVCSDTSLEPIEILRLYGLRFKIEVNFKSALHTIGTYLYHFWMSGMKAIKRPSGNQYLHHEDDKYRDAVRRKLHAYHNFIQTGVTAQGLLLYLASCATTTVWQSFGSYLRTIRPNTLPSEMVVAMALRNSLPQFLLVSGSSTILKKFLCHRMDFSRAETFRLVA